MKLNQITDAMIDNYRRMWNEQRGVDFPGSDYDLRNIIAAVGTASDTATQDEWTLADMAEWCVEHHE